MGWDAHRDSRDSAPRWNELFRVMFMVIVLSVGMAKQIRSAEMPSSSVRVAWQSGSWMILRKLTAAATTISCAVSQSTSRDGQLCQCHPERSVGSPQGGWHSAAPRCLLARKGFDYICIGRPNRKNIISEYSKSLNVVK